MGKRYEIIQRVGSTAFGDIYSVVAPDGETAMVKLVHRQYAYGIDVEILREAVARTLAASEHHSIPKPIGLVSVQGRAGMVIHNVDGVALSTLAFGAPMPPAAALGLIAGAAEALEHAWTTEVQGVPLHWYHGDLQPGSVHLAADGKVTVTDFGLTDALMADARDMDLESTAIFGSLPYIAPERLLGRHSDTVDTYALGVMLYEMLVGSRCSGSPTAHADPVKHADRTGALASAVTRVIGDQHDDIAQLITSMLAWNPEERPDRTELRERTAALAENLTSLQLSEWSKKAVPQGIAALDALAQEGEPGLVGAPVICVDIGPPTTIEPQLETPPPTEERIRSGNVPGLDRPPTALDAARSRWIPLLVGAIIGGAAVGVTIWLMG